jgi:hypothetical protein
MIKEKASFYKRFGTFSGRHVVIIRSRDLIEGAWSFGNTPFLRNLSHTKMKNKK